MKILGKIALIFTGCFLLFAVIGNIALSFNGGVKASFQQVYDRLEEVWPYELFGRAEESLDQIADRLESQTGQAAVWNRFSLGRPTVRCIGRQGPSY